MTWTEISNLITEWWPIVLAGLISVVTFVGGAYVIYTKMSSVVQPILDKITLFRSEDDVKATVASELEQIQIDTMKADLLYKIQNDTVSDELTLVYQAQLDKLNALTSSVADITDEVKEAVNPYIG